jgi:hypothetical protein
MGTFIMYFLIISLSALASPTVLQVFYVPLTVHLKFFFTIKATLRTNFPNLFWHESLHVSGCSSVHHQEFIHGTFDTGICHSGLKRAFGQDQVLLESCLQICMTYTSVECTVNKLLMMDRGTAKIFGISCQNKFGKLVRLVGFITKEKYPTGICVNRTLLYGASGLSVK